jgi:branched-chain amino acid transport system permease protein
MSYAFHLVTITGIYVILALSLNIVAGYAGLLSLCQAAFYGIGAYGVALLTLQGGLTVWQAVVVSMLIAAVFAGILGSTATRFSADYFVIATFAFQILTFSLLNNLVVLTGGPNGIGGIPQPQLFGKTLSSPAVFAAIVCILAAGALLACILIENAQFGRILRAMREDETFLRSLGTRVGVFKVSAFAVSGAMAALAGGMYASYITYIDPTSFTFAESLTILTMVIVGGLGNAFGAVFGACLFTLLPEGLRFLGIDGAIADNLRQMLFGALLVLVVVLRPGGLFEEKIAKIRASRQ